MKVSEIFQVETALAPGNLASVLNVIAEAGMFALSTPDPQIDPAAALAAGAAVAADGRSINNVLCFPGLFDAVLRTRARSLPVRLRIHSSVVSTIPSNSAFVSTLGKIRACAHDS
jgi:hypothetical protein